MMGSQQYFTRFEMTQETGIASIPGSSLQPIFFLINHLNMFDNAGNIETDTNPFAMSRPVAGNRLQTVVYVHRAQRQGLRGAQLRQGMQQDVRIHTAAVGDTQPWVGGELQFLGEDAPKRLGREAGININAPRIPQPASGVGNGA